MKKKAKQGTTPTDLRQPQESLPLKIAAAKGDVEKKFDIIIDLIQDSRQHTDRVLSELVTKINQMEDTMAQTFQDLKDAIQGTDQKVDALKTSVDALLTQAPAEVDTTEEVTAVNALGDKVDGIKADVDAKLNPSA